MDKTSPALISLEDAVRWPVDTIGGKARRLARLRADGYLVADGFVLPVGVQAQSWPQHDTVSSTAGFPDDLRTAFQHACDHLGFPLIVRSSAVAEDLDQASFAGQFESVLHVADADEAVAAVERCWTAAHSSHLAEYARARGTGNSGLAVLVQRQLAPRAAGVSFGKDPVTGSDRVVIEAVPGLADGLLDGGVSPERWVVDAGTPARIASTSSDDVLSVADTLRIAALVDELGRVFNAPQDVEWALVGDDLFVLQSRPVTTLQAPDQTSGPSRPAPPKTWIRETMHWPDRISPLGAGVWERGACGLGDACAEFGLLIGTVKLHAAGHRAYMEALPFGGAKLPPPPAWLLRTLIRTIPPLRKRIARSVNAVRSDLAGEILERWLTKDAKRTADELAARRAIDLTDMGISELLEELEDAIALFERASADHYLTHVALSQVIAEYAFTARELLHWEPEFALITLRARSVASTDAATDLNALANRLVLTDPSSTAAESIDALLAGDDAVAGPIRDYLERYGTRVLGSDPMDPTLADSPQLLQSPLMAAIDRARHRQSPHPDSPTDHGPEAEVSDAIELAQRGLPSDTQATFDRVLARATRYFGIRDESEVLGIGEPLGLIRRIALELGERLTARDNLERPDDCFMLTPAELQDAAAGASHLKELAESRRREFDAAALVPDMDLVPVLPEVDLAPLPPEARFANDAFVWYLLTIAGPRTPDAPTGTLIAGTPASAGQHRGPVRVVRGPQDFHRIRQGDVLVCPTTSPSWSPILAQVGAVVADHGGALSHPAIIAREFGIPAIVGTARGTTTLADGQIVLVDGSEGVVRPLPLLGPRT